MPQTIHYVIDNQAGNVANCYENWTQLTRDKWVLQSVKGLKIPFLDFPSQMLPPRPFRMSVEEQLFVDDEIHDLLCKGVLKEVNHTEGEWISNIFLRPKQNGKFRMILDLTQLNKLVEYQHFKMFNLRTALDLIVKDCWMASADLTDAYYSLLITPEHRKFLRFVWRGALFEYQVLPNGLSPAPRFFTKILKPLYADMGRKGHVSFPYIDDSFVMGKTKHICKVAVDDLVLGFKNLGFQVNEDKSVLEPTQCLKFLGFLIDSRSMTVSLTLEKKEKFTSFSTLLLQDSSPTIREVAAVIGLMVAYSPAVEYSGAHYKNLERDKIKALKRAKGDFRQKMWLSEQGRGDIKWWLNNLDSSRLIRRSDPDMELFTDASEAGWGAHRGNQQTGGRWTTEDIAHINVLELKAILFGLKSLCRVSDKHIRIRTDSSTALAYVKNMGGTKSADCLEVALSIWNWAQSHNVWLSVTHIPGVDNVLADLRSRKFKDHLEWSLNFKIFEEICLWFGTPDVDLFASRNNTKLPRYVSWEPEPDSWRTDAFSFSWNDNMLYYCFPPFSLLPRVINKIQQDQARAIVIAPNWESQPWLPLLFREATTTLRFPTRPGNLTGQEQDSQYIRNASIRDTSLTAFLFLPTL